MRSRRCYVNPMTCQHKPFLSNNGQVSAAWDTCMDPGMNTTIDAGAWEARYPMCLMWHRTHAAALASSHWRLLTYHHSSQGTQRDRQKD